MALLKLVFLEGQRANSFCVLYSSFLGWLCPQAIGETAWQFLCVQTVYGCTSLWLKGLRDKRYHFQLQMCHNTVGCVMHVWLCDVKATDPIGMAAQLLTCKCGWLELRIEIHNGDTPNPFPCFPFQPLDLPPLSGPRCHSAPSVPLPRGHGLVGD